MAEPPPKRLRRDRSRSRERPPPYRDHERDRSTRDRSQERENSRRDRDRNQSRDRHRSSREHPSSRSERQPRRSRSPRRNGEGASTRARTPPRPKHERDDDLLTSSSSLKGPLPSKAQTQSEPPDRASSKKTKMDIDSQVDEDPEDVALQRMMGFTSFKTTQNTKVPGNQIYGVRKEKTTEYRQYMNRVGGFNRPLSPSR